MEENINTLRVKAKELFYYENFKAIIELLTNEILEKQKDAELYAWRARANYRLDYDVDVTMLFAEKAIDADPNYFMGYFARACAWVVKKENKQAIADFTKVIDLNSNFADAYYHRGIIFELKKENEKAAIDYDKAMEIYNKDIENYPDYADAYNSRGYIWYYKMHYDEAITDYTKAIEINPNFEIALYNRGLAWVAKKKFCKARMDYTKVIKLKPNYTEVYYNDRGLTWKAEKKYNKAISDYTKAIGINPNFENAYYNRGLAKKEYNFDLVGSKQDFEKYLELTNNKNELWAKYAKFYIEELKDKIINPELCIIEQLINKIKNKLLINDKCITHYTSLSVLKSLILDNSKFRISEGNFMNDPSEGKELFNFLNDNSPNLHKNGYSTKNIIPKPFIGSFVPRGKNDDLNMWRFYGKEKGIEAKGCAITLNTHKFIENIEESLSNEKNKEARLDDENGINFYRVVYVINDRSNNFYIPNSDKSLELGILMKELKDKVNNYKGENKTFIEKYLNSIAFLFKSEAYKNENEVRLIVKGIEFEKEYIMDVSSPRVYIELVPIKNIVSQITLGPKVDEVTEWVAAFYYSYEKKTPKILISRQPYK